MAISMIDTIQPHLNPKQATDNRTAVVRKGGAGPIAPSRRYQAEGDVVARRSRFAGRQLERLKERLNGMARQIRTADQTMDTIDRQIESMKARLTTFVKHFPPFPPGSEDRVRLLNSFTAFRKQINRLTFPPEQGHDIVPMGDSSMVARPGNAPDIGPEAQPVTLQPRPVHTGEAGLDIPVMPSAETDAEIKPFISILDRAQQTLGARRSGLAEEVASMPIYDDGFADEKMGEPEARQQSLEVRHTFVEQSQMRMAMRYDHLRQLVA